MQISGAQLKGISILQQDRSRVVALPLRLPRLLFHMNVQQRSVITDGVHPSIVQRSSSIKKSCGPVELLLDEFRFLAGGERLGSRTGFL
eukprot:11064481-Heterocapsa_arctica.AAC.1